MEFNDEKKEKLERLERKLYSRNISNIDHTERSEFNPRIEEPEGIKENWQNAKSNGFDELAAKVSKMAQKKHNFINKIFIFSTLFFVAACGVAIFVFFGGVNSISSKNVDIKVVGPLSVGGGQEVSFDISIINNNNVDLDSASLLLEYPAGTRSVSDLTKDLLWIK